MINNPSTITYERYLIDLSILILDIKKLELKIQEDDMILQLWLKMSQLHYCNQPINEDRIMASITLCPFNFAT